MNTAFDAAFTAIKREANPTQAYINDAIDVLAKPENKEALRAAVKTERDSVGLVIVVGAIAKLNDREAVPALLDRLREMKSNEDGYLAGVNIAMLMGEWKIKEAVDPLLDLPAFYFPHGGAPPLLKLGPDSARRLLESTAQSSGARRAQAEELIALFRDPDAKDILVAAAKSGRRSAVKALGHYAVPDVEQVLSDISGSGDPALADAAVASLLKINPVRHRLRVFPLLRSGDTERVLLGCRLAGHYRLTAATAALAALLKDPSQEIAFASLEALAELEGEEVVARPNADGTWTVEGGEIATLQLSESSVVAELKRRMARSR